MLTGMAENYLQLHVQFVKQRYMFQSLIIIVVYNLVQQHIPVLLSVHVVCICKHVYMKLYKPGI